MATDAVTVSRRGRQDYRRTVRENTRKFLGAHRARAIYR